MTRKLDVKKVDEALQRAGRNALQGDRLVRSGRFLQRHAMSKQSQSSSSRAETRRTK